MILVVKVMGYPLLEDSGEFDESIEMISEIQNIRHRSIEFPTLFRHDFEPRKFGKVCRSRKN